MCILRLFCTVYFFAMGVYCLAQNGFVQFIASDIQSHADAIALTSLLDQHEGITSSRAEMKDNNVLIFLNEGVHYTKAEIRSWPEFAQYELSCFRTGVVGTNPIVRLTPENCSEPAEGANE